MAEHLTFNKISTGAQDDLDKVTKMAYGQVKLRDQMYLTLHKCYQHL